MLALRDPSFTTARRIVEVINERFGDDTATARDPATVRVQVPEDFEGDPVRLVSELQGLDVEASTPARIVIDERTGTIVLGAGVTISEVAIAQGGLTIEVGERLAVSQPNALAEGETAVVPESEVRAEVRQGAVHHVQAAANLSEVVQALNALGATPRDLIAIFQALRTAGALRADIEVR